MSIWTCVYVYVRVFSQMGGGGAEREREGGGTDGQTDRQIDGQDGRTGGQTDRHRDNETDREKGGARAAKRECFFTSMAIGSTKNKACGNST